MSQSLIVFADGGSRGNPGPAAIGFVVKDRQGRTLTKQSKIIGTTTNNVAEYAAVIEALKWAKDSALAGNAIVFFLDSQLVVNQLNGVFKVKNHRLRNLVIEVRQLERSLGAEIIYRFIPREKNSVADSLVNQAFDQIKP